MRITKKGSSLKFRNAVVAATAAWEGTSHHNLFEDGSTDTRQMMYSYTGVKRTLHNGDKTGIYNLYG